MGFWDNIANIYSHPSGRLDRHSEALANARQFAQDIDSQKPQNQPENWGNTSALGKAQYAYNNIARPEMKATRLQNRLHDIALPLNREPSKNSYSALTANMELGKKPTPEYDANGTVLNQKDIDLWDYRKRNQDAAESTRQRQIAQRNKRADRLYSKYEDTIGGLNATKKDFGLQGDAALTRDEFGLMPSEGSLDATGGEDGTTAPPVSGSDGAKSSGNVSAAEVTEEENPYAAHMENGYFDENAYLAHLLEEAENEYWAKTFPELMEKYNIDDITTANLANLINEMNWDEFHDYATDEYIYDPLYSHAFIMDENGNREYVDLNDEYDWGRYADFYGGMNLQNEAESGNWANVGAITGTGTNVAGQQIADITGYNPMTGDFTNSMNIPVSTADFEQVYGAFPAVYAANGFPEGDYNADELSQEQKAIIAGTLADIIGRDAYIRYLNDEPGAYNNSQYAIGDDGIVDDFYMIDGPDEINPYFSNLSYYSSRG